MNFIYLVVVLIYIADNVVWSQTSTTTVVPTVSSSTSSNSQTTTPTITTTATIPITTLSSTSTSNTGSSSSIISTTSVSTSATTTISTTPASTSATVSTSSKTNSFVSATTQKINDTLVPSEWTNELRSALDYVAPAAEWLHDLPRSNANAEKGRNQIFGSDEDGPYFEPFISILIFAGCMGILFVLVGVLSCVLRYVCLLCGGSEPDPDGYSTAGKLVPSVALLAFGLIVLVVGYLALWGDSLVSASVKPIAPDMSARAARLANASSTLIARVRAIDTSAKPYDCAPYCNRTENRMLLLGGFPLDDYVNSGKRVHTQAKKGEDQYDTLRSASVGLLATYLFFLTIVVLMACAAGIFQISRLATGVAVCSFVVMFVAWLFIGLQFAISVGAADVCFFNDTPLLQRDESAVLADEALVKQANSQFELGSVYLPTNQTAGFIVYQLMVNLMLNDTNRINYINNASSPASSVAALRAEDAELRQLSVQLQRQRAGYWVVDGIAHWRGVACGDALDGSVVQWATSFVVAILLLPMAFCAWLGEKRFAGDDDEGDFYY